MLCLCIHRHLSGSPKRTKHDIQQHLFMQLLSKDGTKCFFRFLLWYVTETLAPNINIFIKTKMITKLQGRREESCSRKMARKLTNVNLNIIIFLNNNDNTHRHSNAVYKSIVPVFSLLSGIILWWYDVAVMCCRWPPCNIHIYQFSRIAVSWYCYYQGKGIVRVLYHE